MHRQLQRLHSLRAAILRREAAAASTATSQRLAGGGARPARDVEGRRIFNAARRHLLCGGSVATRLDPDLWEEAKRRACSEGGLCRHSARKMQWAVRQYKRSGGRYAGPKRHDNRLVRWGREKWRTRDGTPSRGKTRYLPDAAWDELTPAQQRRADRTKARGHRDGKQYVANPPAAKRAARRARRSSRGRGSTNKKK